MLYRYGLIYRDAIHTSKIDWCQLMTKGGGNLVEEKFLELMTDNFPEFIQLCPYHVNELIDT